MNIVGVVLPQALEICGGGNPVCFVGRAVICRLFLVQSPLLNLDIPLSCRNTTIPREISL